jgi:hypothetical protein
VVGARETTAMAGCCLKPVIRLNNLSSNAASNKNNMNTGRRVGAEAAYGVRRSRM